MDLKSFYNKLEFSECEGCSILDKSLPFHCKKDYESVSHVDILFVTDSYRFNGWKEEIYSDNDMKFILDNIQGITNYKYAFTPAVKCPSIKEADMTGKNSNICRKHLAETIQAFKPKLIITLGNLAFKMLMKKSGVKKHHGTEFSYEGIPVVPTYSLGILYIEPSYGAQIAQDINLGINKVIRKNIKPLDLNKTIISSLDEFRQLDIQHGLEHLTTPIAIDIETEGLNFLTDKILTVSFTYQYKDDIWNTCVPLFHKDSPLSEAEVYEALALIGWIVANPKNIKVLQKANFDLKFFLVHGIVFVNVWDTKGMAHMVDEYQQGDLLSLVKKYEPESLGVL